MFIRVRIGEKTERKDTGDTKEEGAEAGALAKKRKVSNAIKTTR